MIVLMRQRRQFVHDRRGARTWVCQEEILDDIDKKVDQNKLEEVLMQEGLAKFADPQKALIKLIGQKRPR